MNKLLWVLQVLAALLYGSSGVMKVFMFDKVSQDVPSFGALPRKAWMTLGILELADRIHMSPGRFLSADVQRIAVALRGRRHQVLRPVLARDLKRMKRSHRPTFRVGMP
jgi:hypothetical protein